MKFVFAVLFALGVLISGSAAASEKLAQSSGCMTCHAIDKKPLAPATRTSLPSTAVIKVPKPTW